MKGFTLVEILIVIAVSLMIVLTLPMGISFYRSQQFDTTANGVIQALRRAQLKATSQADYSFGIYVGSGQTGQYVLFRGDSYSSCDDKEIFDISNNISFNGISEVTFSKLGGIPSVTGDIVLTNGYDTGTISINGVGRISYEYSTSPPPSYCWGTGGSCNSACQYTNYGEFTNYYTDPGCSEFCPPADSFYVEPDGSCSGDGTGSCYKMDNPLTQYTVCSQGNSCEGSCSGTCAPCRILNEEQCNQQEGCSFLDTPGGGVCVGRCTACGDFDAPLDPDGCTNQLGCDWNSTKWYWVLNNLQDGYSSYISCEWLEL